MLVAFALSPLLIVAAGALFLMMAESFSTTRTPTRPGGPMRTVEHASGLALGTTIVFLAGVVFSAAVWLRGAGSIPGVDAVAPWLVIDRFSLFFDALLCVSDRA